MNNKIWSADRILWLNSNIGCFEILIEREVTHYDAVKQ